MPTTRQPPDDVERMYRLLVQTIRARFPRYLHDSFDVGELHQTILPYRMHSRELDLPTNEAYELTLARLIAGDKAYLVVDERMRDALRAELATGHPDPASVRRFAAARIALSPAAREAEGVGAPIPGRSSLSATQASPAVPEPRTFTANAGPLTTPPVAKVTLPAVAMPTPTGARSVTPLDDAKCRSCGEGLPTGRPITFCPHCGQDVTTVNCAACGAELDVGWRYCPTCGRATGVE